MKRTPFLFFSVENREAHFPHRPDDGEADPGQDRLKGKASIPDRRPHSAAEKQSIPTHTVNIMTYPAPGCNPNFTVFPGMFPPCVRTLLWNLCSICHILFIHEQFLTWEEDILVYELQISMYDNVLFRMGGVV